MRNLENYKDMLPQEAVPMYGIRILAYYDSRGQMAYRVSPDENGTTHITSLLGLLEMVKIDLAQSAHRLGKELLEGDDE